MLEGFRLEFDPPIPGLDLSYMTHVEKHGDTQWMDGGAWLGSRTLSGAPVRLEGFAIKLTGPSAPNYTVKYMAHLQDTGDTPWVADGAFCGTKGKSRRVEGMQAVVVAR